MNSENNNKNIKKNQKFFEKKNKFSSDFIEKVILIRKINKVTRGGRRLRFSTVVIVGNRKGTIGLGISKANEVPDSIRKSIEAAHKNLVKINITKESDSIIHETLGKYCGSKILLKPAKEGIGIKAGGAARDVIELAGINNIYSKAFGSRNKINLAKATINGLSSVKSHHYFFKKNTNDI